MSTQILFVDIYPLPDFSSNPDPTHTQLQTVCYLYYLDQLGKIRTEFGRKADQHEPES